MFAIGTKVVHPCYGAGTIVRIQNKDIGSSSHPYYIIDTVVRPMQLMVPVGQADTFGLRQVGVEAGLRATLLQLTVRPEETEIEPDLRTRQGEMQRLLKSGHFTDVVHVVRQLVFMNSRRPLGTVDRQLLDRGKELLAGELALACSTEVAAAMREVEDRLSEMLGIA